MSAEPDESSHGLWDDDVDEEADELDEADQLTSRLRQVVLAHPWQLVQGRTGLVQVCAACAKAWPCPTVRLADPLAELRALDGWGGGVV